MRVLEIDELRTVRRVLFLARAQRASVLVVGVLALLAAVFEAMGLAFLIPLAMAIGAQEISFDVSVIGPLLVVIDSYFSLDALRLTLVIFALFAIGIAFGYLNAIYSNVLAMRFAHRLRMQVFETALNRSLASIESLPSGKMVNNLVTETWRTCDALFAVIYIVVQIITCGVFLGFLMLLTPFYTLVLVLMTTLMAILVHVATRTVKSMGQAGVAANESFMAYVWDALAGLRVIRGFGREAHERERFAERSSRVSEVFIRLGYVSNLVGPITQLATVGMVVAIVAIALLVGDPISTLVGFLAIAYRMQPRVSAILGSRTQLRSLECSVAEMEKALEGAAAEPSGGRAFSGLRRGVFVQGVSVRYPNMDRPALYDVTCAFPYGQVTAVAGYSGSGKSTLVALLLRFLEPEKGRILVDGVPLSDIQPESWHRRIAFVEQNAFLFNASVRENIGYGDLEADFAAILEAARIAQADSFISELPEGYETVVGAHGVRLSQGQRQRVALARSLLRRPDVLILDEATNALDRPTERALRAAIEQAREARAVIVIAHRRETIEAADQVVVLDRGRIVEAGRPGELAHAKAVYAQLYLDSPVARGT